MADETERGLVDGACYRVRWPDGPWIEATCECHDTGDGSEPFLIPDDGIGGGFRPERFAEIGERVLRNGEFVRVRRPRCPDWEVGEWVEGGGHDGTGALFLTGDWHPYRLADFAQVGTAISMPEAQNMERTDG